MFNRERSKSRGCNQADGRNVLHFFQPMPPMNSRERVQARQRGQTPNAFDPNRAIREDVDEAGLPLSRSTPTITRVDPRLQAQAARSGGAATPQQQRWEHQLRQPPQQRSAEQLRQQPPLRAQQQAGPDRADQNRFQPRAGAGQPPHQPRTGQQPQVQAERAQHQAGQQPRPHPQHPQQQRVDRPGPQPHFHRAPVENLRSQQQNNQNRSFQNVQPHGGGGNNSTPRPPASASARHVSGNQAPHPLHRLASGNPAPPPLHRLASGNLPHPSGNLPHPSGNLPPVHPHPSDNLPHPTPVHPHPAPVQPPPYNPSGNHPPPYHRQPPVNPHPPLPFAVAEQLRRRIDSSDSSPASSDHGDDDVELLDVLQNNRNQMAVDEPVPMVNGLGPPTPSAALLQNGLGGGGGVGSVPGRPGAGLGGGGNVDQAGIVPIFPQQQELAQQIRVHFERAELRKAMLERMQMGITAFRSEVERSLERGVNGRR